MTAGALWATWMRRWRVVATCALLGLLAAAGAFVVLPTRYTATSDVLVNPVSVTASQGAASTQVNMASERSTATSGEVLEMAVSLLRSDAGDGIEAGDGSDAAALRQAVSISVPTGSSVLQVSVTTGDSARTVRWANAVAEAYLRQRAAAATTSTRRITQQLQEEVARVTRVRATATAADRSLYDQQLVQLWERQQNLNTAATDPGRILTSAATPTETPSGLAVFLVGGGALGVLVGAALALVRDRRDPAVRHREWLRQALPQAVLADDPQLRVHARRILALAAAATPPVHRVVLMSPDGPLPQVLRDYLQEEARRLRDIDHADPTPALPTAPRIVDASVEHEPNDQARCITADDLVVLEVGSRTRRGDVARVVAELLVVRSHVHYVAFRPATGWAPSAMSPTPAAPGIADTADQHAFRVTVRPGRARRQEVSP